MAHLIRNPLLMVFGVLFGLVLVIVTLTYLSSSGFGGASVSTAVVSTGSTFTNLLPFIGAMLAGGMVLVAIGGARK